MKYLHILWATAFVYCILSVFASRLHADTSRAQLTLVSNVSGIANIKQNSDGSITLKTNTYITISFDPVTNIVTVISN